MVPSRWSPRLSRRWLTVRPRPGMGTAVRDRPTRREDSHAQRRTHRAPPTSPSRRCGPTSPTSAPPRSGTRRRCAPTRTSGDGGVGTTYHNVSKLLGTEQEVDYVVTEYDVEQTFQLAGDAGSIKLLDTITFEPAGAGHRRDLPRRVHPAGRREARRAADAARAEAPGRQGGGQHGGEARPALRPVRRTNGEPSPALGWRGDLRPAQRPHPPLAGLGPRPPAATQAGDRADARAWWCPARNEAATVGDVVGRVREALMDTTRAARRDRGDRLRLHRRHLRRGHRRGRGRAPLPRDPARPRHPSRQGRGDVEVAVRHPRRPDRVHGRRPRSTGTRTSCRACSGRCWPTTASRW